MEDGSGNATRKRPWRSGRKRFEAGALALLAALVVAFLLATASWAAEGAQVTLEVMPGEIELPLQARGNEVIVALRNPTGETLRKLRLSRTTEAGVTVTVAEPAPETLAPRGEAVWVLKVTQSGDALTPGAVRFRVDYEAQAEEQDAAVPRVIFATLEVKTRALETVESRADVQLRTTLSVLNEKRPGVVYLTIANKSNTPLRVKRPVPNDQEFVSLTVLDKREVVTLAPREHIVHTIQVEAKPLVRPGKYILFFSVPVEWDTAWGVQTGDLVANQTIDVGVFGESEILAAVAVPSFFLLPGFLFVGTALFIWGFRKTKEERERSWLKMNAPEFWIIAVTLSIMIALMYPFITDRFLRQRIDYLDNYGFADIARVWLGSVLLSALVSVVVPGGRNLLRWGHLTWRSWQAARLTITPVDEPIDVLRRLKRKNLQARLQRVKFQWGGEERRGFVLGRWDGGGAAEGYLVGPTIAVQWIEGADGELQKKVELQLEEDGDLGKLVNLLENGRHRKQLSVRWRPGQGQVDGIRRVTEAKEDGTDSIVEQEYPR